LKAGNLRGCSGGAIASCRLHHLSPGLYAMSPHKPWLALLCMHIYYLFAYCAGTRQFTSPGALRKAVQSWKGLCFPARCFGGFSMIFSTIILFLSLEIYTCNCNNKLESSEDTSSTVSNIFRGCWVLWEQVRVIPSCIFLNELGARGGNGVAILS
jgi:hypothetical protein